MHAVSAGGNVPGYPAGPVHVSSCSTVVPTITGRMYFGDACTPGSYTNTNYAAMNFVGRTFSYTINLAGARCGCVAALYLVNMRQNGAAGNCGGDYYCDACEVCGVRCAEIDIMEANRLIWKTTLHRATDPGGKHSYVTWPRYGPASHCINTDFPFHVKATVKSDIHHPTSVHVVLTQGACSLSVAPVIYPGMFRPLDAGMTPVVSYWYPVKPGQNTKWFDGAHCSHYNYNLCARTVQLSNFAVSPPIK